MTKTTTTFYSISPGKGLSLLLFYLFLLGHIPSLLINEMEQKYMKKVYLFYI